MIRLNINVDHVATLRNQRDTTYPSPTEAALSCLEAGADGITIHLREDRRHIRDADAFEIRRALHHLPEHIGNRNSKVLNLEMAATEQMCKIASEVKPNIITLVPEKREERTTEGGLDVIKNRAAIEEIQAMCREEQIGLSLFIEASLPQIEASKELGASQVEFHTGHYCDAPSQQAAEYLPGFQMAFDRAHAIGLEIAAGHGLSVDNVGPIARLAHLAELNIGHSVICHSIFEGMAHAVLSLRSAIDHALIQSKDLPLSQSP